MISMTQRVWEKGDNLPNLPFNENKSWLVIGSAGCGKSTAIAKTIDYLLIEGVLSSEIMYVLFNKHPADTFRADFLKNHAEDGFTEKSIPYFGTFHSLCLKLMPFGTKVLTGKGLNEWGEKNGFHFGKIKKDQEFGIDEINDEDTEDKKTLSSMEFKIYTGGKDKFLPRERLLYEKLNSHANMSGLYTHVMYLEYVVNRQLVPNGIRYVFIDEGQDNSKIQFDYFLHLLSLSSIRGLMLVGDDKQAINVFKGGDAIRFLNFPVERYWHLPTTRRCPLAVLQFANSIIAPVKERSPITDQTTNPKITKVQFYSYIDNLMNQIKGVLKERPGKSIFILSRHRLFLTKYVIPILKSWDIPYLTSSLITAVKTLATCARIKKTGNFTRDDLFALLPPEKNTADGVFLTTYLWKHGIISNYYKAKSGSLTPTMKKHYPELIELLQREALIVGNEVISTLEDASEIGITQKFLDDLKNDKLNVNMFRGGGELMKYALNVLKNYGENFTPVCLSTIHSAKGAECDWLILLNNIIAKTEQAERIDRDNERRVWYTATTRSRSLLYISSVNTGWRKMVSSILPSL